MSLLYAALMGLSATAVPYSGVAQDSAKQCETLPAVELASSTAIVDTTVAGLEQLPFGSREKASLSQYRPDAIVNLWVNGLGFVSDVNFEHSTGNRRVDMAIVAWMRGYKFEERACGAAPSYMFRMNIDLRPGAAG